MGVANIDKKKTGNLASRDLVDVLTPEVVRDGDFVYTDHLTTLVAILPQNGVDQFLAGYENYADVDLGVVPGSAKRFVNDKLKGEDGSQLWRIVLFRTAVEPFLKKFREERNGTCRVF